LGASFEKQFPMISTAKDRFDLTEVLSPPPPAVGEVGAACPAAAPSFGFLISAAASKCAWFL